MSEIYRCDHCGDLVELSDRKGRVWRAKLTEWGRNDRHEERVFDLCPECARKVMDYIKGEA